MKSGPSGFSLPELLTVIAIVGVMVLVALPAMGSLRRQAAMRAAIGEATSALRAARSSAIARSGHVAVKFQQFDGVWHYAFVDDGDGDGVRNDDIKSGIDRRRGAWRELLDPQSIVRIALPSYPVRDPDTGKFLPKGAAAVRFNASTLCSFGPLGGGTAGSVFFTDSHERVAIVRVTGASGRIRALVYDRGSGTWGEP